MSADEQKESSVEQRILGDLGLTWDDLRGKKVLDMGAGLGELAEEGKKHGVEIISLDKLEGGAEREGGATPPKDIPFVVADAVKMPFGGNKFDLIISHAAPPTLSESTEEIKDILNEAKRVLKEGGEFRFGPGGTTFEGADQGPEDPNERARWLAERSLEEIKKLDWEGEVRYRENDPDPLRNYFILHKKKSEK